MAAAQYAGTPDFYNPAKNSGKGCVVKRIKTKVNIVVFVVLAKNMTNYSYGYPHMLISVL